MVTTSELDLGRYKLGWSDVEDFYVFKPKKGLSEDIVREMSWMKGEPEWMTKRRLKALRHFQRRPMPTWGGDMSGIDFSDIFYYIKPIDKQVNAWDQLPESVKATYDKLGIPEAERKYLAGVTAQYESEVVYHRNREDLEAQGVLFCDMDTALREYPELVKQYFGNGHPRQRQQVRRAQHGGLVRWQLHLRAARGEGRHAPAGLLPDQLREHGPVRADADHRRRGRSGALHRGLLRPGVHHRLAALGGRRDRLQAVEPGDLHDHPELVEQRLQPGHQAGPLRRRGPHGVDRRQHRQPADHEVPGGLPDGSQGLRRGALGGLRRRAASTRTPGPRWSTPPPRRPRPSSPSRSPRTAAGPPTGAWSKFEEGARKSKSFVRCDALLLDDISRSDTYPYIEFGEKDAQVGHEATVSKVGDDQLFYLMSRGLSEQQAMSMIVNGFIEPVTRTLPMEYAVEWSRLIELQMEGSVG